MLSKNLVCPKCGNDGTNEDKPLHYVVHVPTTYVIVGVDNANKMARYDPYSSDPLGEDPLAIMCGCGEEFPIPEDWEFDWDEG